MVQRLRTPANRRFRLVLVLAIMFGVTSISTIVALYTDQLWFREVGFQSVFYGIFGTKVSLGLIFGAAFFTVMLVNLLIASRLMPAYGPVLDPRDPFERVRVQILPYIRWASLGISAFLAFLFAVGVGQQWEKFLLLRNAVKFGSTDPLFHRDLGFYMFKFPAYSFTYGWAFSSLFMIILVTAGAHFLLGGIRPQAPLGSRVSPQVKAHLSVLIGLLAILRAFGYRLDQFRLLYSRRGDITGATFTDVHAHLPALQLLFIISLIGAILFFVNIRFRGWALPVAGVGLWILTSILAGGLYPAFVQKFKVVPAQIQKEEPFLRRTIAATRAAYDLEKIKVREFPADPGISQQVLAENGATVSNIRLFSPQILKTAYRQLQEIRTYYQFNDVDVDRYQIGGQLRQVMLSTRELNLTPLESLSWQNNHLFYTHGYGAVVSPTNETSPEGQPLFLLQDIPSRSNEPSLDIKQGGIYYGEGLSDYSLVNTKQKELDYEEQDRSQLTTYAGDGGVKVGGFMRRLAFAWRFRDVNLLISGLVRKESKIIYIRQVRERLEKAAPFLSFDGDPYPVIVDGRIVWVADAYTTSSMYPYSEAVDFGARTAPSSGIGAPTMPGRRNYIRNSVKVTIDAYNGTMKFYVWDPKDPIIQVWNKAFPALFSPASEIPVSINEHFRYPEDQFRIQSFVYTQYHVTDPSTFFFRQDRWVIPRDPNKGEGTAAATQEEEIQPYYVLMRLPGAPTEDYLLILPMNPKDRPNMVSYLAADSGPDGYGELSDFRFPRTRQIFGVGQIHARINATQSISREISLLNQQGSRVVFGNLLVIPIGQSILYVQPLFLQSDQNAIPELKFVILATKEEVAIGNSLQDALAKLVAGEGEAISTPTDGGPPAVPGDAVKQALQHLIAADEAARRGDWATYGREQQLAREALERAASPSPSASPTTSASPSG